MLQNFALHQAYDQHGDNRRVAERNSNKQHLVKLEGGDITGKTSKTVVGQCKVMDRAQRD